MALETGAFFSSYQEFQDILKKNEDECGVLFVKASSKKLRDESPYLERLQYQQITFTCKQGHRTRTSTSQGIRPNQKTLKTGCPAFIRLVEDRTTCKLKVASCHLVHENHPTGKEFSQLYPENRKPSMSSELKMLFSVQSVPARDIQDIVRQNSGQILLRHDVWNLKYKLCDQGSGEESENVAKVLETLQAEGGMVKYGINEGGEFKYLAFMTKEMLHYLAQFPEVLIMDTTYKVNKNNYPLLNILVVDSNGQGRPVFHAFLASEDAVVLSSCLSFFSSAFSSNLPKTIFVDKAMAEICAIRTSLPSVAIRLCAFHTATAVRKALQQRKLPSSQVTCLFELFANQMSCTDVSEYNALKDKMSELSSPDVVKYFTDNWWNCPQLWAASFLVSQTFHVTTTNHAETFHQKIKKVLSSKTPLSNSITELLKMTKITMQSRDASACLRSISLKYNTEHNSDIVNEIQNDLSSNAADWVVEQFLISKKTKYVFQCSLTCPDTYLMSSETSSSSPYSCTIHSCSCDFFLKFNLPCRHIFALRSYLSLPIYHCNDGRFKSTPITPASLDSIDHSITHEVLPTRNASTPESRYHITKEITKAIESFFPLLGVQAFETAISHLNRVFTLIKSARPLAVVDLSEADIQTLPCMDNLCSDVLPTLSEPSSSVSSDSVGAAVLPTLSEPSSSVSSDSVGAAVLPTLSEPSSSVSSDSVGAAVLPTLSEPSSSVSSDSVGAAVLPTLSEPSSSVSSDSVGAAVLPTLSEPSSSVSSDSVGAAVLPTLSEPSSSVSSDSVGAAVLPTLSEPSSSVSSDSVGAAVLPTLSEPSSSVSSDSVGAAVLPTLSEPSSSVSSDSVGAAVLPTLSEPSSSVSSDRVGADFSIPASSSAASSCGFSNVKMSLVKTKGRPRQVQAFTRRYNKRKTCPQDFHSRSCEEKKQMLLSGCLLDSSVLPPYSVSNLKSPENILSVFANESISLSSIEHLFVEEAWVTLQARIEEKIKKELFSCNSCANRDDGEIKMIECEGCLEWYHYQCVGVRTNSKPSKWFCVDCWR